MGQDTLFFSDCQIVKYISALYVDTLTFWFSAETYGPTKLVVAMPKTSNPTRTKMAVICHMLALVF
jgi:hypothetical protein